VRLVVPSTPHSLYTITIHTNQPVLQTIPARNTPENTRKHNHTQNTLPTSHPSSHLPTPPAILSSHSIHHHTHNHAITSPRQPTTDTQTQHKHTRLHQHTTHSPKDDLAPTHTHNPKPSRSRCLPGILQDPMLTLPFTQYHLGTVWGPAVGIDPETSEAKHSSPAGERVCHCTLLLRKKAPQHTKVAHVCTRV
jgi:hypothetical protein